MKKIILASSLGAVIAVAVGILVNIWVGLAVGMSVAYLAHNFRSETVTGTKQLAATISNFNKRSLLKQKTDRNLDPRIFFLVGIYRCLAIFTIMVGMGVGLPCLYFIEEWLEIDLPPTWPPFIDGVLDSCPGDNELFTKAMSKNDLFLLIALPFVLAFSILSLVPTLLLSVAWICVQIYSRERLLCATSAAIGGWSGLYWQAAANSPILSLAIGTVIGGAVGAIQYRLLTLPLQKRFARTA